MDSKTSMDPNSYLEYLKTKTNELTKRKEIKDFYFKVSYIPHELMLINQIEDSTDNSSFQEVLLEKRNYSYFNVEIGCVNKSEDVMRKGVSNEEEYFQLAEYYSFRFQNDIKLIVGQDTLPCVLSQFDRTFGLTPTINIICMFENKNSHENESHDFIFELYDNCYNCGIVKFVFDGDEISNLPNLILSENVK